MKKYNYFLLLFFIFNPAYGNTPTGSSSLTPPSVNNMYQSEATIDTPTAQSGGGQNIELKCPVDENSQNVLVGASVSGDGSPFVKTYTYKFYRNVIETKWYIDKTNNSSEPMLTDYNYYGDITCSPIQKTIDWQEINS